MIIFSVLGPTGQKCQAWKESLQSWYHCFSIACKDINGSWSRSGQGPFQASPCSQIPCASKGSGKCGSLCGVKESRAARQGFGLSLFSLVGLQFITAPGPPVCKSCCFAKAKLQQPKALHALMETGLGFTGGWKGCSCKGEDLDHPFAPELNKLPGKVSAPQGNVLLCHCSKKATNLRREEKYSHLKCKQLRDLFLILH